ncbi:unnamed protein product [Linum tenue]|uniref:AP2/ERF domain-containing protein n=1 Tax=Linum tenue TaxID=586396 RepID=A0AAV0I077_9ROSI|nr:unnamed protein product [Linum tenue]
MMEEAAALGGGRRARKRFVGVRQRPSGRWVAEIKDTIQKIRVWLGTYDTTEEAARAYDEAACLLRGANTRTNFWPCSSPNSKPVLPPKITNLLLHRLKARNRDLATERIGDDPAPKSTKQSIVACPLEEHHGVEMSENRDLNGFLSIDSNNNSGVGNPYPVSVGNNNIIGDEGFGDGGYRGVTNGNNRDWFATFGDENRGNRDDGDRGSDVGKGHLMNEFHQQQPYSAFDIAQEMMEPLSKQMSDQNRSAEGVDRHGNGVDEEDAGEPLVVSEISKRLNYERKFSASLYAYSGVTECLSRATRSTISDEVTTKKMRIGDYSVVCDLKGSSEEAAEEKLKGRNVNHLNNIISSGSNTSAGSASASASNVEEDGELSLWSSLDLPSLCFSI